MKIEKGKLYLAKESGTLFKADMTTDNYYNFASDKIAVHCPTKEDWDYVVSQGYYLGQTYVFENWSYDLYCKDFSDLKNFDVIITISEFKKFYPEQDKFAELKEAHKNGKTIECLQYDGTWFEVENPKWQTDSEYRIKPEQEQDPYNWVNNALEAGAKEAIKFEDGKLTWEVDFDFLEGIADRMQLSSKYPPYNWQKPLDYKKLLTAGFRHYVQIMKGNFKDDGQEYGHLFAVVTNLMMAYYQLKNNVNKKNEN